MNFVFTRKIENGTISNFQTHDLWLKEYLVPHNPLFIESKINIGPLRIGFDYPPPFSNETARVLISL